MTRLAALALLAVSCVGPSPVVPSATPTGSYGPAFVPSASPASPAPSATVLGAMASPEIVQPEDCSTLQYFVGDVVELTVVSCPGYEISVDASGNVTARAVER